jgi:hypothetical protein
MQKTLILFLTCMLCVGKVQGQISANWYFGNGNIFKFEKDSTYLSTGGVMNTRHDLIPISISDQTGKILFYSDGYTVWNGQNEVIHNGTALFGGRSLNVVPIPNQPNKFLILTLGFGTALPSLKIDEKPKIVMLTNQRLDSFQRGLLRHPNLDDMQLRYSILDMSKNNGKGEITEKNTLLKKGMLSDFVVANHRNRRDFWIITRAHKSEEFATYLISEKGITEKPILQKIGKSFELVYSYIDGAPSLTFKTTMQGNKIALLWHEKTTSNIQLFDFDNQTGKLSNAKVIDKGDNLYGMNCRGFEFSPDGKKLYTSQAVSYTTGKDLTSLTWEIAEYDMGRLYQAPITSKIPILIKEKQKNMEAVYMWVSKLQIAPDMRIYFSTNSVSMGSMNEKCSFVGCIEKPNEGIKGNINKTKYCLHTREDLFYFPRCTHLINVEDKIELGKPFTREILFETNQAILKPEYEKELQDILAYLLKNPKTTIEIAGHTDNEGEEAKNKTLSENRAQALADFLIKNKVGKERIKATGYGSAKPIADNSLPAGKAKNRRIEFLIK